MPASYIEAEATGQEFVTAQYGGKSWTIQLDVDAWPVDLIAASVLVVDTKVGVDYPKLTAAIELVLGDQWPDFLAVAPKRRDLIPASQTFAAAVGIGYSDRTDIVFGAIPRLLRELAQWPGPVESTLRAAGHDYRDRWLHTDGRRRLTLRQIHVALENSAWDSPLAIARNGGRRPFSDEAIAVMDLFEAITKTPYYRRPLSAEAKAERESTARGAAANAVADYRRRHGQVVSPNAERRRTAAETARANAQFAKERKAAAHAR